MMKKFNAKRASEKMAEYKKKAMDAKAVGDIANYNRYNELSDTWFILYEFWTNTD